MSETKLMHKIMLAMSKAGARVFRNQVGQGYYGRAEHIKDAGEVMLYPGDVVIRGARRLTSGLIKGSSDLIGWHTRVVIPADVGHDHAIFVAAEVKTEDGELEPEQDNFLRAVKAAGGIAIEARSVEQAVNELNRKGIV